MKKRIQTIITTLAVILGNIIVSQNDTLYVVQSDVIIGRYATATTDSVIFNKPNLTTIKDSITKDTDGNIYTSIIIGPQEWMTENLRTTKYADGSSIPNVIEDSLWTGLTIGAWCHYENDSSQYEAIYGKLYNWYAASDSRNVCPTGWHVPTAVDWRFLIDYLTLNGHNYTEGRALKATSGWNSDRNGTDNYGWKALPGGNRRFSGSFVDAGSYGGWWTSSETFSGSGSYKYLRSSSASPYTDGNSKKGGFSVRCLRD